MQIQIAEIDYRSISRESFSSLKFLLTSVDAYLDNKARPFKGNARTILGTAIHMHIQGLTDLVQVTPEIKMILKSGIDGKFNDKLAQDQWIIEQKKINPDLHFISDHQMQICKTILEKATKLGILDIVKQCEIETAHIFEVNELKLKGRLDLQSKEVLYDIKTTESSLEKRSLRYTIDDSHYDMQAAMYVEAVRQATGKILPYKMIFMNTKAPFEIKLIKLSDQTIRNGYEKMYYCIERLKNINTYQDILVEEEI